jgi:hypothetical protein
MAEEARAQLSGELTVNKVGMDTPITGTLSGTRGQYTLIAGPLVRRFDVVSAQVRFLGDPTPNPAIDITARRAVFDPAGRQIDVDVRVTGTLETPRLSLAGGEAVGVAESELLSFLLFGRPTFALGGEVALGEDVLQQTLTGVLAEVLAIELERGPRRIGSRRLPDPAGRRTAGRAALADRRAGPSAPARRVPHRGDGRDRAAGRHRRGRGDAGCTGRAPGLGVRPAIAGAPGVGAGLRWAGVPRRGAGAAAQSITAVAGRAAAALDILTLGEVQPGLQHGSAHPVERRFRQQPDRTHALVVGQLLEHASAPGHTKMQSASARSSARSVSGPMATTRVSDERR